MDSLLTTAAGISTMWSLAAFGIAALGGYITLKQKGKVPSIAWAIIAAIVLLGLVPISGSLYLQLNKNWLEAEEKKEQQQSMAIYRVRVTVLDPEQIPVNEAKVTSSMGGEAKRVEGGWQFDIPAASKPSDGNLIIYATVPSAFLRGQNQVHLASDYSPNATVQLNKGDSAMIRGIVKDGHGGSLRAAVVSVVGYGKESVTTGPDGGFQLKAHAAEGRQVQLHVERKGYRPADQMAPRRRCGGNARFRSQLSHSDTRISVDYCIAKRYCLI